MRFLFATVQGFESEFYGRVGMLLERRGHQVAHVTVSRRAAARLRRSGADAQALAELAPALVPVDVGAERRRIVEEYALEALRELWATDPPCAGRSDAWCDERAVRHIVALERVFERFRPQIVVPEVGVELIRAAAEHVARARGVTTFFLFYTIFPRPLRLYADSMQAPIVAAEDVRPLTGAEREELEAFRRSFIGRDEPIRAHRALGVTRRRVQRFGSYCVAKLGPDRDNDYLHPVHWARENVSEAVRARAARRFYSAPVPERPYVYFPLHTASDYKIRRLVPHLADQAAIVDRLVAALPAGYELVLKEHPLAIGRTPLTKLRQLSRHPAVRLVAPRRSTHELIRGATAIAVIGSTVGLEALLYGKPVLTIGRPFYAGCGVTLDIDSPDELGAALPELLRYRPDPERIARFLHAAMRRCYPGAPVLVANSDENADALARSLEDAADDLLGTGTVAGHG